MNIINIHNKVITWLEYWTILCPVLLLVLCLSPSSGAEVNHEGQNKRTPLHEASDAGHPTITEVLIKQGADPIPRDDNDSTPYDLAFHKGHTKVCLSRCIPLSL